MVAEGLESVKTVVFSRQGVLEVNSRQLYTVATAMWPEVAGLVFTLPRLIVREIPIS